MFYPHPLSNSCDGPYMFQNRMACADFTKTMGKESEEAFESECDACKLDDKIREAKYYCPDCEDHLCMECENHHKKVKATRFHDIVSVADRNANAEAKTQVKRLICHCGQNEEVNFYCGEHDSCFCSLCKNVKHRRCSTVSIDEASSGASVVSDFITLAERTDSLIDKATELKVEHKELKEKLEQLEERGKENIRKFRCKLNQVLDELEQESLDQLQSTVESTFNQLEDNKTAISSTLQLLQKDSNVVEEVKKTQDKRQLLLVSSKLRSSHLDYEAVLTDVKNKMEVPEVEFEHNKSLANLQNMIASLGKICVSQHNARSNRLRNVLLGATVTRSSKVDIKSLYSKSEPSISGVEFLETGELLIADHGSAQLVLLDELLNIKSTLKCAGPPYDITIINGTEAIATLPYQQTLLYVTTRQNLNSNREGHLDNRCWGITNCRGNIYVACNYSGERPEILELDMEGKVRRIIRCNQLAKSQCYIFNIAVNNEGTKLFVSDYWSHKVICMNTDGCMIYAYSASDVRYPRGILVDGDDNALVCCESSNIVHVIKADGKKFGSMLTSKDDIHTPFAIDYRTTDGILIVGCWKSNSLLCYMLRTNETNI